MPSSQDSHDQYLFVKTNLVASFAVLTGKDMDLIVFSKFYFFFFVQHPDSYLPLRYVVKNIRIIEKELFLFLD